MNMRGALFAISLAIAAWLAFFADKTPSAEVVQPMSRSTSPSSPATAAPAAAASRSEAYGKPGQEIAILALQARDALIARSDEAKPHDGVFAAQSWTPPPRPAPAPTPVAPPLPFSFLGKKMEDNQWEVYLGRKDETFIARERTVIEDTYRVDSIKPPTLVVTYLPLNEVQTLSIGGPD